MQLSIELLVIFAIGAVPVRWPRTYKNFHFVEPTARSTPLLGSYLLVGIDMSQFFEAAKAIATSEADVRYVAESIVCSHLKDTYLAILRNARSNDPASDATRQGNTFVPASVI